MAVQIQLRRGSAAAWTAANPTLAEGELGLELNTSKAKLGDGATAWNALSYYIAPAGAGIIPVGGIIMWSGTIATIPATWALCDGSSNSPGPDLRDKFVVGATSDSGGVAKTNIEGSLKQTGGVTGHLHSAHGNLTHSGASVGDHTGLTHGLTISDHPGLTHGLISLPGLTHPVLTIEGQTHAVQSLGSRNDAVGAGLTHPLLTIEGQTHAVQSLASRNDLAAAGLTHPILTIEGMTHSAFRTINSSVGAAGTLGTLVTGSTALASHPTFTASAPASHPTHSVTLPAWSISPASHPTFTASAPASHPTHSVTIPAWSISPASHPTFTASAPASHPSATTSIAAHAASDYGTHSFTAPAAHGTAGTLTHSFTEPSDHAISVHDTVSTLPNYFALAFIQRMV